MICRITLNLRTTVYGSAAYDEQTTGSLHLTDLPPRRRRSRYNSAGRRFSVPTSSLTVTSSLHIGVKVQTRTEIERTSAYGQLNDFSGVQRPRRVRYDNFAQDGEAHLGLSSINTSPAFSTRYSDSPSFASGSGWRMSDPPSFPGSGMHQPEYGAIPASPISADVPTYAFASLGESSPRDENFQNVRSASTVSMYGPSDMEWKRKSDMTLNWAT